MIRRQAERLMPNCLKIHSPHLFLLIRFGFFVLREENRVLVLQVFGFAMVLPIRTPTLNGPMICNEPNMEDIFCGSGAQP